MTEFPEGLDVPLTIMFGDDRQPDIPAVGSVYYTVYNHAGQPIQELIDVPVSTGATDFRVRITIPAEHNLIGAGHLFSKRTILMRYQVGGLIKTKRVGYRLLPVTNHSVTPKMVRDFLGVRADEVEDDAMDLFVTYLEVAERVTKPVLDAALISGTHAEIKANELIVAWQVLKILPSLKNRMAQSQSNGVHRYNRPLIKNFDELYARAAGIVSASLTSIIGGTSESPVYVVFTNDVDPITGGS